MGTMCATDFRGVDIPMLFEVNEIVSSHTGTNSAVEGINILILYNCAETIH